MKFQIGQALKPILLQIALAKLQTDVYQQCPFAQWVPARFAAYWLNFQRRQKIQPSQIINSSQMCGKSGRFEIFTSIHHKCAEVREVEVFTSTHHKCAEVREVEVFISTHHKCAEVREVEGFTSIHHKCASRGD